jgi:hypothetical protein
MAVYFAVYDQQSLGHNLPSEPTFAGGELMTPPEEAKTIKLSAESAATARQLLEHFYGGDIVHRSTIVTEANWEEGS